MRTVLLLLVVGLLIAWYFYRQGLDRPEERQDRRILQGPKNIERYHAVSIKPGAYACRAANEITGKRFLASEAPSMPLPGCDAAKCDCHFIHHKDRRAGKDRRSPFTSGGVAAATGSFPGERRKGQDRRDESGDY
ncbi:MAG: hypothetical protein GWP60_11705 [Gammaproteobacteria bacterium]|jgi:hypothetical protein|nr:hypothetical protein [Gammaproteobacteria bacterium]